MLSSKKTCKGCGEYKPISEFDLSTHLRRNGTRGHKQHCKTCRPSDADTMGIMTCEVCGETKPSNKFAWLGGGGDTIRIPKCRNCRSVEIAGQRVQSEEEGAIYSGKCHGCAITQKELGYKRQDRLQKDYAASGDFRGWLCKHCKDADVLGEGQVATRHPL